jgi:hypothetical protein
MHVILDDGGFADARLRGSGLAASIAMAPSKKAKREQ